MENEQSVWKQIKEDREDYQYFKQQDDEKLRLTLQAIRKLGIDKTQED